MVVKYLFKIVKNKSVQFVNNVNEKTYYDSSLGKIISLDNDKMGEINVLNKVLTNKLGKKKCVVTVDIDFDLFVQLEKEVSKYPTVNLDYTVIVNDKKYADLRESLKEFRSNLIKEYELVGRYENKYTIRYVLGSNNKTLETKELQTFKERFISHIKKSGFEIIE